MIFAVLLIFLLAKFPSTPDDPPSTELHQASLQPVPPNADIVTAEPPRCDSSGNLFLRTYGNNSDNAPIVELSPDGSSILRTFDFRSLNNSGIAYPEPSAIFDYQVRGSSLHAIGQDGLQNLIAIKFSLGHASHSAFPLSEGFFPQRLTALDSGNVLVLG